MNSFETVIVQLGVLDKSLSNVEAISIRFFEELLLKVIRSMPKQFCSDNYKKIFEFFKTTFGLTNSYFKNNEETDMKGFKKVETAIANCF